MLKNRIVPCLDIKDGRTVKGTNFLALRDAGDPVELAQKYSQQGADELVFLDVTATVEKRKTLVELVKRIAKHIHIPFTVGGGIASLEDAQAVLEAGADKISVNSAAVKKPSLIRELAKNLGEQCVVVSIDTKKTDHLWWVYVNGGKKKFEKELLQWVKEADALGAGEILLTSIDKDGTKSGFDIEVLKAVGDCTNLPIIASGGAGTKDHFVEVFEHTKATAALAASVFHYNEIPLAELKGFLNKNKIAVR